MASKRQNRKPPDDFLPTGRPIFIAQEPRTKLVAFANERKSVVARWVLKSGRRAELEIVPCG